MRIAFISNEVHGQLLRLSAQLRLMGYGTLVIGPSADQRPGYVCGTRVWPAWTDEDGSLREGGESLAQILDEEAPDLLHILDLHSLHARALRSAFGEAQRRDLPTVVTVGESDPDSSESARSALESADAVVVCRRHLLGRFAALGFQSQDWYHVPPGVDYSRTPDRRSHRGGLGVLSIAPSAGDEERRLIAEAMSLLGDRSAHIALVADPLEGSGHEPELDAAVMAVPRLLDEDSFVHALRAVACGVPLLVPDTEVHRELIGEYRCGFTFRDGDAQDLAGLLARLISEPGLLAQAHEAMRYPPGVEEEAWRLERIYDAACSKRRPRGRSSGIGGVAQRQQSDPRLLGGSIESPPHNGSVPRAGIVLSGWAICEPGPVNRATVLMDGHPIGPVRLGLGTPHLLERFSCPEAAVAGFDCWLDLSSLPADQVAVRLEVQLEGADGSLFALSPVEVELEDPLRPDSDALERAEQLQRRVRPNALRGQKSSTSEVRLVAFTHDLGYGGAQLYLFELLRRLSGEPWFSCTVVSPAEGPLAAELEALGFGVHVTSEYPVESIASYEGKQLELAAWVGQQGFNVALANTLLSFPAVDLAGRLGIPSVWSIHESYESSAFWHFAYFTPTSIHPLVHHRAETALGCAAAVIFEADSTRRMYERYGDRRRFATVAYGIELSTIDAYRTSVDRVDIRRRLGLPESAVVLLCLGIVEARKGQTVLAQAFRQVAEAHPDAVCVFVGDKGGSYAEALRRYLERAGLASRTRIVPVLADIYPWYLASDVFVCSSDLESLPRTVLEAMAFELGVASTRVFGLGELLEDGRTGYLCEPGDVGALARMLERVLGTPVSERQAVARAGARLVRERHDSSHYAAAYGRLFRALAADPDVFPSAAGL